MLKYIYATINGKSIFINTDTICSVKPLNPGCLIVLANGENIRVKEDQNTIIHRIFGVTLKKN